MNKLIASVKDHQLIAIGTLAGVIVAWVTLFRKPAAPVVNVASPVVTSPAPDDLAAALTLAGQLSDALTGGGNASTQPVVPPTSTQPPAGSTAPIFSGALHQATVTGASGNVWSTGNPSIASKMPKGTTFGVAQINLDGKIWWVVESVGLNLGNYIRYHDPDWSVSP